MASWSPSPPAGLCENRPLAELTTLELGGAARYFVTAATLPVLSHALVWAREQELAVAILGGGSNLVVADAGFPGLVIAIGLGGVDLEPEDGMVRLTAAAGEAWDDVVGLAVAEDLAGIECLSGIPGTAGATPIQNVGAYGQQVADVIDRVRVLDRLTLKVSELSAAECAFAYRWSRLRSEPDRFVVLAVCMLLRPGGRPRIEYPELARALAATGAEPGLADVRQAVLDLRRAKSMVLDPGDPNRRSVGSFFVNPVLDDARFARIVEQALARGWVASSEDVPRYPGPPGSKKIPAAWLIERAGFVRGQRHGQVGISDHHALALVHHGQGSTAQLVEFAAEICTRVGELFDINLRPEPAFIGFGPSFAGSALMLAQPNAAMLV